jgi:hypothetical protein
VQGDGVRLAAIGGFDGSVDVLGHDVHLGSRVVVVWG